MVCDELEAALVDILQSPWESGIVGPRKAEVDDLDEVCEQEYVDKNVRIVNASDCQYCIQEPSQQKDC